MHHHYLSVKLQITGWPPWERNGFLCQTVTVADRLGLCDGFHEEVSQEPNRQAGTVVSLKPRWGACGTGRACSADF